MTRTLILACIGAFVLIACSSSKPSGPQRSPQLGRQAEYETGRVAFQKMYVSARGWAADAIPFRLQSQFTPDAPVNQGKAGLWRASFASPAKRMMKMFIWSGLVGPEAPAPGVSFTTEDTWNPSNTSTRVFDLGFLKVDSDKAYEVAEKNGGSKLTRKDPKQPVFFILDWDAPRNELVWHVVYGNSEDEAKLRIAVNASTGQFVRVER